MNIRESYGITLVSVATTVVVLLIILGISTIGINQNQKNIEENAQVSELNVIQHAILERYTKSQLTKENLPGSIINKSEVQTIIDEINTKTKRNISLKGTEYKELNKTDLEELGITGEEDIFIVNYKTGEVINKTIKVTQSGKALYIYSKSEN